MERQSITAVLEVISMYRKRSRVELILRFQRFSSTAWISDKWISHQVFAQLDRNLTDSGHGMFSPWLSLRWFNALEPSLQCFDSRLYPPVLDDLFVSGSELLTLRSESFSLCFRTWIVRHPFIVWSLVVLYLAEQLTPRPVISDMQQTCLDVCYRWFGVSNIQRSAQSWVTRCFGGCCRVINLQSFIMIHTFSSRAKAIPLDFLSSIARDLSFEHSTP